MKGMPLLSHMSNDAERQMKNCGFLVSFIYETDIHFRKTVKLKPDLWRNNECDENAIYAFGWLELSDLDKKRNSAPVR